MLYKYSSIFDLLGCQIFTNFIFSWLPENDSVKFDCTVYIHGRNPHSHKKLLFHLGILIKYYTIKLL
jgi:hypothetical protein